MHLVGKALKTLMTLDWPHLGPPPTGSGAPHKLSPGSPAPSRALLVLCLSPVLLVVLPPG